MYRGSVWRKWDLHVHTPASFHHQFRLSKEEKERYQLNIWEKYISELEKVLDVSVVGITDYFSIEGYKKVLKYKGEGRLQNFDLILPNIEFRLDKFVADRRLNYHVIFSDEIGADRIESEFLEELHIKTHTGETRKLTRENIEEIGRTLKEHQETFRNRFDYIVGCENITVSLDEIIKVLRNKESIFDGKYILVLEEEGWDSINWAGQDHLTRKTILVQSHAIFSSNPNTRNWVLGKKDLSPEDFIREFGSLKSCIHGSDAHTFEKLCKPDEDRFCWIKADPTFEGLKQIIYEPEERVRIQPENPEYRKNIYTLSSVKILNSQISDELSIEEQKIPLNKNLVAVTGGKGSGKTALLDLIANCFEDRCRRAGEDRNSFVQRIEDQKQDLEVKIEFIGEDIGEFFKKLTEENFFQDTRVTYLPQGQIEEYSGDRQKLDKKIEEVIFGNKKVIEGRYKEKFDLLKGEINEITKQIDKINREIYELEEDTKEEIIAEIKGKKRIKEGELKDKEDELKRLTESMEEGIKESIEKLKSEEIELRVKHSKFENVKTNLGQFKDKLEGFLDDSNNTINNLNYELSELQVDLIIPRLDFKPQLDAIQKALELIPQRIEDVTKQIEKKKEELSQLSGVKKAHAELLKEIDSIKTNVGAFEQQLKELEKKKDKIKSLESERMEKYKTLLSKYWEWREYYKEVIKAFTIGKSEIMGGIDFESSIYFDKDRFIEFGSDILDQRKINADEVEKCAELLEVSITENTLENLVDSLKEFVQKIFEYKKFLKGTRTSYDFYKWTFGNYFSLSTEILFKGISMDKLSMGQKGTVLLKLFLAEGDYPLIIDQPEESLDNKFIYGELVEAFREAKKNRQIIIATNNANLVVNTDAEQIIVAEFKNNKISYKLGTLEDLNLREDIMPILEGGKEAFKKREEKYGI
jgi:ABC-type lipoprotein export system ATPase subunit